MAKLTKLNSSVIDIQEVSEEIQSLVGSGAGKEVADLLLASSNLPDSNDITIIEDQITDLQNRTAVLDGTIGGGSVEFDYQYVNDNLDDPNKDEFVRQMSKREDRFLTVAVSGEFNGDACIAVYSFRKTMIDISPPTAAFSNMVLENKFVFDSTEEVINYTCYDGDIYVITRISSGTSYTLRRLQFVNSVTFDMIWETSITSNGTVGPGHGEISVSDNFVALAMHKGSTSEMILFNPADGSEYVRQDLTQKIRMFIMRNDVDRIAALVQDSQADPEFIVRSINVSTSSIAPGAADSIGVTTSNYTPLFCQVYKTSPLTTLFVVGGSVTGAVNSVYTVTLSDISPAYAVTATAQMFPGINGPASGNPDYIPEFNNTVGLKIVTPAVFTGSVFPSPTYPSTTYQTLYCIGQSRFNDLDAGSFNDMRFTNYVMDTVGSNESLLIEDSNTVQEVPILSPGDSFNNAGITPVYYSPTGAYGLYVCRDGTEYGIYVVEEASRESIDTNVLASEANNRFASEARFGVTEVEGEVFSFDSIVASGTTGLGSGGVTIDDGLNGRGKYPNGEVKMMPLFINTNETYYKVR